MWRILTIIFGSSLAFSPSPTLTRNSASVLMYRSRAKLFSQNTTLGFDPVESVGSFMGYPSDKKWKGVRFFVYSFIAGMTLADGTEQLQHYLSEKFQNNHL